MKSINYALISLAVITGGLALAYVYYSSSPSWQAHTIHSGACCTDGTRLADLDHDGQTDIVTTIEESGGILLLFKDGAGYQTALIGADTIKRPEDALLVDLNGDGFDDVLASQENRSFKHTICMNPAEPSAVRVAANWRCSTIPASENQRSWLLAEPFASTDNAISFVAGGKTRNDGQPGGISLLTGTRSATGELQWTLATLDDEAEWIMSIEIRDVDGDGLDDIVYVDRKGSTAGVKWLQQMPASQTTWKLHLVSAGVSQAMDGAFYNEEFIALERKGSWYLSAYSLPAGQITWQRKLPDGYCTPRSFVIANFDADKSDEAVILCSTTRFQFPRIYSLDLSDPHALPETIVNTPGTWFSKTKYDIAHAIDMDGDGDADLLTDEETYNGVGLGVVWYENPLR